MTLTINSRTYAPNNDALVNSLFSKGGTMDGTYKKTKNTIKFYNLQGTIIAEYNKKNNVLAAAHVLQDKKVWYTHLPFDHVLYIDDYTKMRELEKTLFTMLTN